MRVKKLSVTPQLSGCCGTYSIRFSDQHREKVKSAHHLNKAPKASLGRRRSPHGAEVPASYGRVVGCGELAAVVVGAPLAGGELQLTFTLEGGGAGDLRRDGGAFVSGDEHSSVRV